MPPLPACHALAALVGRRGSQFVWYAEPLCDSGMAWALNAPWAACIARRPPAPQGGTCHNLTLPAYLGLWRAVQATRDLVEAVSVLAGPQLQTVLSARQWALMRSTMKPAFSATKRRP